MPLSRFYFETLNRFSSIENLEYIEIYKVRIRAAEVSRLDKPDLTDERKVSHQWLV